LPKSLYFACHAASEFYPRNLLVSQAASALRGFRPYQFLRGANAGTFVAGLAVVALGIVSYRTVAKVGSTFEMVSHTEEVIASIRGVLASVSRAEAGQREYVLTGDHDQYMSYSEAARSSVQEVAPLRKLVADNPQQTRRVRRLDSLIVARVARLDEVVKIYNQKGFDSAQAMIQTGAGSAITEQISSLGDELQKEESRLLVSRLDAARTSQRNALLLILSSVLLTVLVLLVTGYRLSTDYQRKKKTEKQLREALQSANAANEAKTQFLATVSHEIRTPLNAIVGMTDLLLDTRLESEQSEFARTIQANSESLLILISDLLDSSKIEAGQVDLESIPFSPEAIIESVAEILEIRAELKGLDIIASVDTSLPRQISGDPNRFRQVLMNLVGNAVKFTTTGEIVIRATLEHPEGSEAAGVLSVCVQDTGIGIAPEDIDKIFERFVQAERSTVRRFGGTGLGLPISRSLVELMGGELTVESVPGEGSTFRFYIPIVEVDTVDPAEPEESTLANVRVLIVDPSKSRQQTIADWLRPGQADLTIVSSGVEAVMAAGAADEPFTLAIINEALNDFHTGDLIKSLQSKGRNGSLPSILVTSLNSPSQTGIEKGVVVERLYKPMKRSRLLRLVRQAAGLPVSQQQIPSTVSSFLLRPGDLARPRVLVVEDQRDNWVLATRILTGGGYQVDLAENGMVAVERAKEFTYDLILMDLEMPVVDGLQATGAIRAAEREAESGRVPIVALTAHALEGFRERALAGGMDDYVTKPIKKQQLLDVCDKWIDKRPVVLIADDSAENQVLLTNYLKDRNYKIVTANNGLDAVNIFRRQRVTVLLLDMDMPVMSGYDAARVIRRLPGGEKLPIVAITGYEGAAAREKCITAGCSTFLSKPVRRADMLNLLSGILGGNSSASVPAKSVNKEKPLESDVTSRRTADPFDDSFDSVPRQLAKFRRYSAQHRADLIFTEARRVERIAQNHNLRDLANAASELADAASRDDGDAIKLWVERLSEALKTSERVMGVRRSGLLDSPPEESLDRLTRLAATALHVPTTMITLVDQDRQFFMSEVGAAEPYSTQRGTPISHSFCQYVAARADSLVVDDSREDPLVRNNPAVSELDVIAYAGMPIVTSQGLALGSFCAIDTKPRHWTSAELDMLRDLAALAVAQLERSANERAPHGHVEEAEISPRSEVVESGLSADDDDDDISDLIPGYLEARRADADAMTALLEAKDYAAVKRMGHQMKGSGGAYGFADITRLGREIELAASAEDSEVLARLQLELSDFLKSDPAAAAGE
jgi:signal transduction histidine kinase/CheY-like chemotaxis protein/HPt (histidine-containing phosphotransfer) domain-containing protein